MVKIIFSQTIKRSVRLALCVATLIVIAFCWQQTNADADTLDPIKVTLDLKDMELTVDPVVRPPGVTLVPFRALFEALEMEVRWEPKQKLVTGKSDSMAISLIIGENTAKVNDETFELDKAPEVINGSTMVPIRFIAESTGASVFWDPYDRVITIITVEYMSANNVTKAQIEEAVNEYLAMRKEQAKKEEEESKKNEEKKPSKPAKSVDLKQLDGMYYGFRDDFGGYECGGICWDYYTFLPNNQVFIGIPENGGPETINCATEECLEYTISKDQLRLSNGESLSIEKSKTGFLTISGVKLDSVLTLSDNYRLDNKYKYIGYSGLIGVTGAASSWTYYLTLHSDGTFVLSGVTLGSLGGTLPFGPTTNTSSAEEDETGTYEIRGNTITMKGSDGTTTKELFFIHNDSVKGVSEDIQIGTKNYYFRVDD